MEFVVATIIFIIFNVLVAFAILNVASVADDMEEEYWDNKYGEGEPLEPKDNK